MADSSSLNQTLPTLSAGNIVTVAAKLFSLKGGTYFVASLLAHLWLFLAFGGLGLAIAIIAITFAVTGSNDPSGIAAVIGLILLVALPLLAFVWGRLMAAGGYVTRLIFNHLTHVDETQEAARVQTYPRLWAYFWASIGYGLVLILLYVMIAAVLYGLWVVLSPFLEPLGDLIRTSDQGFFIFLSLLLLAMLLGLALGLIVYYVMARLWYFDAVLAIEDQVGPLASLQRSWQLTRNQGINVMAVLFVGTVVLAPPTIMASLVNYFIPVVSIMLSVTVFPFWQAIKAVHYYELRHRNEGIAFNLEQLPARPRQFLKRVALQTPESIELDFALGGIGSRALAWIIDQTLLFVGLFILWYFGTAIYVYSVVPAVVDTFGSSAIETWNLWTLSIASLLTYALSNGYYIGFETFWRGQTPGKRFAKIRVIQDSGQPVGLRESAIRSLLGLIDLNFFFIGVALVTFGKTEKRLGDFAAGTLIIQDEKQQGQRQASVQLQFEMRSQTTAKTLMQEANLQALTADQYLILRDFLGYRTQLDPPIRKRVIVNLATQLRQIIAPPESPAALNIPDEELLEAAYLACRETIYNQT